MLFTRTWEFALAYCTASVSVTGIRGQYTTTAVLRPISVVIIFIANDSFGHHNYMAIIRLYHVQIRWTSVCDMTEPYRSVQSVHEIQQSPHSTPSQTWLLLSDRNNNKTWNYIITDCCLLINLFIISGGGDVRTFRRVRPWFPSILSLRLASPAKDTSTTMTITLQTEVLVIILSPYGMGHEALLRPVRPSVSLSSFLIILAR